MPPVAGHTLTVRRGSSVLLIGGYSPENGFNHHLLEFSPLSGNWTVAPHTGTPPTGRAGPLHYKMSLKMFAVLCLKKKFLLCCLLFQVSMVTQQCIMNKRMRCMCLVVTVSMLKL